MSNDFVHKGRERKGEKLNHSIFLPTIILLCIICITLFFFLKHFIVKKVKISPFLTTSGLQLIDQGNLYTFTGFNIYQIAFLPGHNVGCGGGYVSDINSFFSTLRPNSIIRFWAWQGSMTTNPTTKQLDWAGIDRVLLAAKKYKQRVIISLGTQSGECDDGKWKDIAWYQNGYKNVYNPTGLTPLSYWDYIQKIVTRYKNSQTVGMWELVNEPETSDCIGYAGTACYGHQTCVDHQKAANALRQFFDTVGSRVKSIDKNHLIESGTIGTGQCGSDNSNYTYVNASPAIDVASFHDYNDNRPMPGDQWNGLKVRLSQMSIIGKPLIIGEVGVLAVDGGKGCSTLIQRKDEIEQKMNTMFSNGVSGILVWNRSPIGDTSCNYDVGNDDPLMNLIKTYSLY